MATLDLNENTEGDTEYYTNQPYDESVAAIGAEEVATPREGMADEAPQMEDESASQMEEKPGIAADESQETAEDTPEAEAGSSGEGAAGEAGGEVMQRKSTKASIPPPRGGGASRAESTGEEDESDDEEDGAVEGAYDPAEYENLPVQPDVKELFQYITRYTPQIIELETKLRPFIPDFIPAVGDIDAFIKVTRPDNAADKIGLEVLDEPCAKQSDSTVLDLQLRQLSKQANLKAMQIKSIEHADQNPKQIEGWIANIGKLHKDKPPPTVHYNRTMPDVDTLMQEWPAEFEEMLKEINLPTSEFDCSLAEYVDIICGLIDIPIYKSKVQSLHLLFTLYSEFKNSQHFRSLGADGGEAPMQPGQGGTGEADRLVLN